MKDKPRKQLSLRFDNYVDLLDEAEKYCKTNNITLTHLVATGLRLAMTRQQPSQLTSHDKTDNNDDRLANLEERQAKIEEQLATTSQASSIAIDRETIRDEIDSRTAYLATAMNQVKAQLEDEIEFLKTRVKILEQNQEEKPESTPVTAEMTTQDAISPMLQEEIESAIAHKLTEENVISPQAGKKLSGEELDREANTIFTRIKRKDTRLNRKGIKIGATIIKEKILEMYPNSEDWISDDAGLDVERALEKQHR
jgi:hypothetical protein